MFGLKKKPQQKQRVLQEGRAYKQVAVTPSAHAELVRIARKTNSSIIDTVDVLVGV